jgi:membrane fusion protein
MHAVVNARALYREEVLAALRQRLHGDPLQLRSAGPMWPAALLGLLCAALPAFIGLAGYSRTAEVSGTLVPRDGLLRLSSPQGGVVLERRVGEGARVTAGAVLFTLNGEHSGGAHGNAEAQIAASMQARRDSLAAELARREQQSRERVRELQRDLALWQEEQRHGALEQSLQAQRVQLAEALASRYAQLQERGVVAVAQAQQYQADLLEQRQRLADLAHTAASSRHVRRDAERQQRELQWQSDHAAAALRRELAQLDEGRIDVETRRAWPVRAPRAGIVGAVLAEPGQSVAPGQPLASLVSDDAPLEAELLAPSRAAGQLRSGQPVQLRYQAFPYQKFGLQHGVVREVSMATLPPDGHGEPLYRVRVSLDSQTVAARGQHYALLPGAVVDARVLLERRRIVEWLFEPVLGLRGRL